MALLGIDIGSSSVKCALLDQDRIIGRSSTAPLPTRYLDQRAEVNPVSLLRAIRQAVTQLGTKRRKAHAIALSAMSPSWVAMDQHGRALTPIVTHQDRRSITIATEIEQRVGRLRHLQLAGNRPFPGGISSTTAAWFLRHEPELMQRADLVGHIPTFLHRQLTGNRVIDPSHASFTGLFDVPGPGGWVDELCQAIGLPMSLLPEIVDSNRIAGRINRQAASELGLPDGMPMLAGIVDGSCAMLLAGARSGQLVNASGSTDVLALATTQPRPHERLLTRRLGVGRKWLSISTLAATGSAITWAKEQLFPDLDWPAFTRLVRKVSGTESTPEQPATKQWPTIEPYFSGDRMSLEQKSARIEGITLGTTRQDLLAGLIFSLAKASADRLNDLAVNPVRMRRDVLITGGTVRILRDALYSQWPGKWIFTEHKDATLRGLGQLSPQSR